MPAPTAVLLGLGCLRRLYPWDEDGFFAVPIVIIVNWDAHADQLLDVPATVRVSLAMYNNREDIDQLIDAIDFARKRLRLTTA